MKRFWPKKIYVEADATEYPLTQRILESSAGVETETVTDIQSLIETLKRRADPIGAGKQYLLLRRDRGRAFKPFPEAKHYLSCDYYTLHVAEGCDMECSYCILQAYLTNPLLTVYVNIEEMLTNLEKFLAANRDRFFRIGTGQLADSLSLDHLTGLSRELVSFFNRQPNAILELKTKSDNVSNLLELENGRNVIVAWSLTSRRIQESEEHKCPSLEQRLLAAKAIAAHAGFSVAFHFDPIIDYPGWEIDYRQVVDRLFTEVPADRISWISLGCLRFLPELKTILQQRFPKSNLPQAEWVRGLDGKMRYFKLRRIEIYQQMVEMITSAAGHQAVPTLYLSMETAEVWQRVFGRTVNRHSVRQLLDRAARASLAYHLKKPIPTAGR